ncbi:MAG: ATP-binding protein, partial [Clostridiales bacterium]
KDYFITFLYEIPDMMFNYKKIENEDYKTVYDALISIFTYNSSNDIMEKLGITISKIVNDSIIIINSIIKNKSKFKINVISGKEKDSFDSDIYLKEFNLTSVLKKLFLYDKVTEVKLSLEELTDNRIIDYINDKNILKEYSNIKIIGIADGEFIIGSVYLLSKDKNLRVNKSRIEILTKYAFFAVSKILKNEILNSNEEKFRLFVEKSPVAIMITDKNGDHIYSNKALLNLTGYNKSEISSKNIIDLVHEKYIEYFYDLFDNLEIEGSSNCELIISKKSNEKSDILLNASVLNSDSYIILLTDITKIKSMERDLIITKNKAISEKESKNQFLVNMSHEIRTPMNGINGFLSILEMTNIDNKQKELIDCIKVSTNKLLTVINDILDISKIEAGKVKLGYSEFSPKNVLESFVINYYSKLENSNINIFLLIGSNMPNYVLGDVDKFKQVISNLLSNAVKFTKEGEIFVQGDGKVLNNDEIKIIVSVRDTGIGICKDNYERIFKTFLQVDSSSTRKYEGTGLGLSISKRLVEIMGGKIMLSSELEKGSEFSFYIKCKNNVSEKNCFTNNLDELKGVKVYLNIKNKIISRIIKYYLIEAKCDIYEYLDIERFLMKITINKLEKSSIIITDYETAKNIIEEGVPIIKIVSDNLEINKKNIDLKQYLVYPPYKKEELWEIIIAALFRKQDIHKIDKVKIVTDDIEINFNIKVLIVEDDLLSRKYFARILDIYSIDYDNAENGLEAVSLFIKNKYDVIFMDCQMPVLDGYEATRKIREIEENEERTYIVAITGNIFTEDKLRCLKMGMDEYLSKPVNIDTLINILKKINKKVKNNF